CQVTVAVLHDFDHRIVGRYLVVPPPQLSPPGPPGSSTTQQSSCRPALTALLAREAQLSGASGRDQGALQTRVFWTDYPPSDAETPILIERLLQGGADVTTQHQMNKAIIQFTAQYLLPLMILANLFALIFVSSRVGGSDALGGVIQFG